jgi:phosphatidylinositol glycan class H protein
LLVLQGLGIQTSTTSRYLFMGPTSTFIPTTQIQDIVIHEAFKGLEVRFYLAVIVKDASELVVVFPVRPSI